MKDAASIFLFENIVHETQKTQNYKKSFSSS